MIVDIKYNYYLTLAAALRKAKGAILPKYFGLRVTRSRDPVILFDSAYLPTVNKRTGMSNYFAIPI